MNFKLFNREFCVERKVVVVGSVIVLLIVGIAIYFLNMYFPGDSGIDLAGINKGPVGTGSPKPVVSGQPKGNLPGDEISIYVRGCVKSPGIVRISKGQIIADALEKAGGLTSDADIENINLVYVLNENVMLTIYPKGYIKSTPEAQSPASAGGKSANYAGKGVEISKDTEGVLVNDGKGSTTAAGDKIEKININTATVEQFDTLPGIGPKKASDIVDYRTKNGNFKSLEGLMDVSGIGESAFAKIKDYIYM